MGYRPEFKDTNNQGLCFYGTKLYGYVSDESKLPSCQFLVLIGKVDPEEIEWWGYGFTHEMVLTPEQFRNFMDLYEKDYYDFRGCSLSEYPDYSIIQKLKESENDKHIEWG